MATPERTGSDGATRSILREAIELLPSVRDPDGTVHTVPFLQCARIAVQILGACAIRTVGRQTDGCSCLSLAVHTSFGR